MVHFQKIDSFQVDPSYKLTNWISTKSGISVVHIGSQSPKFRARIVVKIFPERRGLEKAMMAYDYIKSGIDAISEEGVHEFSSYGIELFPDKMVYTLESYGWKNFLSSLYFYINYYSRLSIEEVWNGQLRRNAVKTHRYHSDIFTIKSILESYKRQAIFDKTHKELIPIISFEGLGINDIANFLTFNHRPTQTCIIIEGNIKEELLESTMEDVDFEFFTGMPFRVNKVAYSPDGPFPHGKVLDLKVPDYYGISARIWNIKVQDPVHYIALWILRAYFDPLNLDKKNSKLYNNFGDFLKSMFTMTRYGLNSSPLSWDEWPRDLNLKILRDYIRCAVMDRDGAKYKIESLVAYIEESFLYEKRDLSTLKLWSEARPHLKTLLSWGTSEWSAIVDKYLAEEPFTINLHGSVFLKELHEQIKKKSFEDDYHHTIMPYFERGRPSGPDLIMKFPDCDEINYPSSKSYRTESAIVSNRIDYYCDHLNKKIKEDSKDIPLFIHFEDFVHEITSIFIVIDTSRMKIKDPFLMHILRVLFTHRFEYLQPWKLDPMNNEEDFPEILDFKFIQGFFDPTLGDHDANPCWDFCQEKLEVVTLKISFFPEKYDKNIKWLSKFLMWRFEDLTSNFQKILVRDLMNEFYEGDMDETDEILATTHDISQFDFDASSIAELKSLVGELFKLENFRVFILGNVRELRHPTHAWKEFAWNLKENEKSELGKFTYMPTPFANLKYSDTLRMSRIPEFGKIILIESERDYAWEWGYLYTPIGCATTEYSKILTCLHFYRGRYSLHDIYGSFQIYKEFLIATMESETDEFIARESLIHCTSEKFIEAASGLKDKKFALDNSPFKCETSYDSAMIKVKSILRNEDTDKVKNFAEVLMSWTQDDIDKKILEWSKVFNAKFSSGMISSSLITDLPRSYELAIDSE